jgi:hypothetical protein
MIVEYNNIKCSSVWYHFDPITVYYKEKTISNPNSDTGMNYVLVHLIISPLPGNLVKIIFQLWPRIP